jgi:GTP-binding protein
MNHYHLLAKKNKQKKLKKESFVEKSLQEKDKRVRMPISHIDKSMPSNDSPRKNESRAQPLITSATFVKGVVGVDSIMEDNIPHVAFIGRSNVGKSSVINSLVNNKKLSRSSSTPGRTTEINFFSITVKNNERKSAAYTSKKCTTEEIDSDLEYSNPVDSEASKHSSYYFVDLPGYGYARASHEARVTLIERIRWYLLSKRPQKSSVVLILDAKVGATKDDEIIYDMVSKSALSDTPTSTETPTQVHATKKAKSQDSNKRCIILLNKIDRLNNRERDLIIKKTTQQFPLCSIIPYSAKLKSGVTDVYNEIGLLHI